MLFRSAVDRQALASEASSATTPASGPDATTAQVPAAGEQATNGCSRVEEQDDVDVPSFMRR